jgi:squalene-hopene cyclase-like protein
MRRLAMRSFFLGVLAFGVTVVLWSVTGVKAVEEALAIGELASEEAYGQAADVETDVKPETGEAAVAEAKGEKDDSEEKMATNNAEATDKPKKSEPVKPGRIPEFAKKGVAWLIAAQHNDGGWGGGSHAHQDVRDPHAVTTDPATTSFTLLALLRAGHTPVAGEYKSQVRKGLEYLVAAVEKAPTEGPLITDVEGTQPQSKLGRNVDTAMTAQYLARAHALLPKDDELQARVDKALDKCLAKLQVSQEKDGSWGQGGGWAPVLQSSLSCSALEIAAANGKEVDKEVLDRARTYQKSNFDAKSGRASSEAAAGVELYAFGGAFRANASEASQAEGLIKAAKDSGKLAADAEVSAENLQIAGANKPEQARKLAAASEQNAAQIARLGDDQLLAGFGNNGGEEFLSYLMTSETLLIAGGDKFHQWQDKMQGRLTKVQNTA